LAIYLKNNGYIANIVDALLHNFNGDFSSLLSKHNALQEFNDPQLIASNKRIENILRKNNIDAQYIFDNSANIIGIIDKNLLKEQAEKDLYEKLHSIEHQVISNYNNKSYTSCLSLLSSLSCPLASFFEHIMVMCDDENVRHNRLMLLGRIYSLLNKIANISSL
jgi:glycyl-tRNA synthetase beta chain